MARPLKPWWQAASQLRSGPTARWIGGRRKRLDSVDWGAAAEVVSGASGAPERFGPEVLVLSDEVQARP